jgi:hypothetical protein
VPYESGESHLGNRFLVGDQDISLSKSTPIPPAKNDRCNAINGLLARLFEANQGISMIYGNRDLIYNHRQPDVCSMLETAFAAMV